VECCYQTLKQVPKGQDNFPEKTLFSGKLKVEDPKSNIALFFYHKGKFFQEIK
jgi:hypothetical protein